jgi:hypothetical protein
MEIKNFWGYMVRTICGSRWEYFMEADTRKETKPEKFIEGIDYYFENGLMVLTAYFLKKRGYCCGNDCRHCPYPNQSKNVSNSSRS